MAFGMAIFVGGYILVSLMVGVCGRKTRLGPVFSAILALVVTPPIMLLLLYLLGPRSPAPLAS